MNGLDLSNLVVPYDSLVPRPLPDFILQPWRKIWRRPGIKTTSCCALTLTGLSFDCLARHPANCSTALLRYSVEI